MNTFTNFRMEVWTDGRHDMASFRADLPALEPHETKGERSISYIWHVVMREEFASMVKTGWESLKDGYHRFDVCGDEVTYYNLDFPTRDRRGVATVPYVRFELPRRVQRLLLKLAKRAWKAQRDAIASGVQPYDVARVSLEFGQATRDRWMRDYGQGKGQVKVELAPMWREEKDAEAKATYAARMAIPAPEDKRDSMGQWKARVLSESIERLKDIARNTTRARSEIATVALSSDLDGYYFRILTPTGKASMNGGVVNHGAREGKEDWSIHT